MNEEVLSAMARAKWNESVTLDIESEDGSPSRMILVPQLDRKNGGIRWEQISEDKAQMVHLQTKKWMFPMLNDRRRNQLYENAIERATREVLHKRKQQQTNEQGLEDIISALDIGTGTGLLAMLTEKYLSKAIDDIGTNATPLMEIKSLEMAGPMADLAKQTIEIERKTRTKKRNSSLSDTERNPYNVEVIEGHSCKILPMKDSNSKHTTNGAAMLCTSELLESGLLAEGWLPAMRDAWERHLDENAIVLPQRARVMAQLVKGCANFCGPHRSLAMGNDEELRLFTTLNEQGMLSDGSYDPVTGNKYGIQVEIHADRYLDTSNGEPVLETLCEPITAIHIDVTKPESIPKSDTITSKHTTVTANKSGKVDGVLFWWELDLFGKDLTYSTKPGSDFQDHWHQCLYVFPSSDAKVTVQKDQTYTLMASHTDANVHFCVSASEVQETNPKKTKLTIPPQVSPIAGPFRCWQLNDASRLAKLRDGIRYALDCLSQRTESASVLDISDFSLCGIMASLLGAERVTSIESSSSGLALATAKVAQIGNALPRDGKLFQIVQCHAESLTHEIVMEREESQSEDGAVDLLVGEPYYEMLEGWPMETALNFFYSIRMLKQKGIVKSNALCVPARATILACGIECNDLANAYNRNLSAGDSSKTKHAHVCGFDHTPIAECWNYDRHGISLPLWEYNNVIPVTEIVTIGTLNYETNTITEGNWETKDDKSWLMAPFTKQNHTCHAIAFWVDYGICNKSESFHTLSTGFGASGQPPCISERQTVRILAKGEPTILGESLVIPRHGLEL